jgi:predicted transcriptional regulator
VLAEEIVEAARAGMRQAEIARITGYTRENVRKICRAGGVEPTD